MNPKASMHPYDVTGIDPILKKTGIMEQDSDLLTNKSQTSEEIQKELPLKYIERNNCVFPPDALTDIPTHYQIKEIFP